MRRVLVFAILLIIIFVLISNIKMKRNNSKYLITQLDQIESLISDRDRINKDISKVDVAWHLDHMLKTINEITNALEESKPEAYRSSFNAARIMSLTFGFIPRGRAKSPEVVRPPDQILTEDIFSQLEIARTNINVLNKLDKNSHFEHPVFGVINKPTTIRFIEVHTNHHLKIIRDILED